MDANNSWRFHHWTYRRTTYLDNYREFKGSVYRYDEACVTNGKGQCTSMIAAGDVGQTTLPGMKTVWQYDNRGRVVSAETTGAGLSAAHTFQWAYHSGDRVTGVTYAGGEQVSYTYDAAGSAWSHAAGRVGRQAYTYDQNGNLASGGDPSYSWNADNQPTTITGSDHVKVSVRRRREVVGRERSRRSGRLVSSIFRRHMRRPSTACCWRLPSLLDSCLSKARAPGPMAFPLPRERQPPSVVTCDHTRRVL